ncbi:MAG: peptidoglycan DD-metalloendopeptidase family protein [Paracoccus sp. (in: a-proteobacteria)]|nr:peptidoglycan DD-metalloendopeptidase family protein [Paracoccus sp. (in: a-proteobacteria)]
MFEVDPRFRQMGRRAQKTRRRSLGLRMLAGVVAALAFGAGIWHVWQPDLGWLTGDDLSQRMTQVDDGFDIARPVAVDTFTDIPGDPLMIPPPDQDAPREGRLIPTPMPLTQAAGANPPGTQLAVMRGDLIRKDHQLMARLPATREEFALFQADRSRRGTSPDITAMNAAIPADQHTTSGVAFLRPPSERALLWEESLIEIAVPAPLAEVLTRHGFDSAQADLIGTRIATNGAVPDELTPGSLLALRFRREDGVRRIIQVSLYAADGYVGSLALSGAGQLVAAADPWADQMLEGRTGQAGAGGQQRLLDVIYSAALRDEVPPDVIGAALAMMAAVHDLDGYADPRDRLTLIWSPTGGRVMFIGTEGPSGRKPCYIVTGAEGLRCFNPGAETATVTPARLSPPVAGILTQRFTPGETSPQRGIVVWSAPEGTPVTASGAGQVTRAISDPVLGAEVEIAHPDGSISRYRGMRAIAPGIAPGIAIAAGAPIGQTGTAPGMDQPGLIFQLIVEGASVNPIPYLTGTTEAGESGAVEALIVQIIQVESAGNPRAQNPLSTATGLGQFIESTWLRMMRSYRPDLTASLSRRELLDLRFDADMSRQMVRHLAQENEAYLRARGHAISPGRLYLAHFLGPAGADQALRADPGQPVGSVMGAAVVRANPFLRNYSIADLQNWADRKMRGIGRSTVPATTAAAVPPEISRYMAEIDALLAQIRG